jgi:hypothetical protein
MNFVCSASHSPFTTSVDCHATLERLIGNVSGFVYRRRHDAHWTMEFVSAGCRDVTGYDPHRFMANGSIAFADLIARSDWKRVNECVELAALHGRRTTIDYLIRVAHGAWVQVEDRLTAVVDSAGKILAVEGVIDRSRCGPVTARPAATIAAEARVAALCSSPSSN